MPPRRGFSAGLLSEAAEESVTRARESFKDEPGDLLTKLLELSCRHSFATLSLFPLTLLLVTSGDTLTEQVSGRRQGGRR